MSSDSKKPTEVHLEDIRSEGRAPIATKPVGHDGARVDVAERRAWSIDGFVALFVSLALIVGGAAMAVVFVTSADSGEPSALAGLLSPLLFALGALALSPLSIVSPGQTRVVQFFGRYVGTLRTPGLLMALPLTSKRLISVRVHNFETNLIKVNDAGGNPVEVGAIVVWQVADTARATFAVEDYESFVRTQAESALRHVTGSHPYDDYDGSGTSLRGSTDVISEQLAYEVAERVSLAGIEIIEVRISHLAYAPEIAQAMLQRQQAGAVVAARAQIVEGAVGMVEMALAKLEEESIVELDDERKAAMVSNLLVVLCGEKSVTPVVNSGSLYS
ncbi:SPFH domain-containing protein [Dermatophilus congolensis]|uniref:SPFH domain-containing protein n=1 Tax=Dermatophilus congolensis TaxID=1863 RepID=UPI00312C812B